MRRGEVAAIFVILFVMFAYLLFYLLTRNL
jgi:hypothetical protein